MQNVLEYLFTLFAVTAGLAYLNYYFLRLPRKTGLLVGALAASLCLRLIEYAWPSFGLSVLLRQYIEQANLGPLLLNVFLGFLLFAGALEVNVQELRSRKWTIFTLATVGVLLSTLLMAAGMFGIFRWIGLDVPWIYCLIFGALISPTDPVSTLGVLRQLRVPAPLQAIISGEALFNDGIGIVLFTVFLQLAQGTGPEPVISVFLLDFIREAGGGALLGLAAGSVAFVAMRGIDEYNIELLISLALVTGTFGVAQRLGVSGPVAVVVAGLFMGSVGVKYAVSDVTRDYLQKFWVLVDELLNSFLFVLIGLQFAAIDLRWTFLAAAGLAIPLSLVVRSFTITLAALPLNLGSQHKLSGIGLLTWSGLRGGISVALALSLTEGPYRAALVTICYGIVIFTMVVQGLSLGRIASWLFPNDDQKTTEIFD